MSSCSSKTACSDTKTCEPQFKNKTCKCVTTNNKNDTSGCNALRTMCAYEEDGVLYACSLGCCQNQCDDGQCPGSGSTAPLNLGSASQNDDRLVRWTVAVLIALIGMLLMSTVSLLN